MVNLLSGATRLKMTYVLLLSIPIQGLIKALLPGYPFTEAVGGEMLAAGWYLQKKSLDNIEKIKLNNGKENTNVG